MKGKRWIGQMDIVKSLPRETRSNVSTVRAVMSWAGTVLYLTLADMRFKLRAEGWQLDQQNGEGTGSTNAMTAENT